MRNFLVLGAGFTGLRVVRLLQQAQHHVVWTTRNGNGGSIRFDTNVNGLSLILPYIDSDTVVLHSIPTLHDTETLFEITPQLSEVFKQKPPARVVYLSTTGVYGQTKSVDHSTPVAPQTNREQLRVTAEEAVQDGPWSSMVLRPAAIYGPNRGIHASMRSGQFRLPEDASNYVSRIHVDDLANHCLAALELDYKGAYPVADQEPCTSFQAAEYCAQLLNIPLPASSPASDLGETRRADRRVDGSAVRKLLGIELLYPSYRTGFPACLAEEDRARSIS